MPIARKRGVPLDLGFADRVLPRLDGPFRQGRRGENHAGLAGVDILEQRVEGATWTGTSGMSASVSFFMTRNTRSDAGWMRLPDLAYNTIAGAKATNRSNWPKSLLDIKRFDGTSIW